MARIASTFWQLARDLHTRQSLGKAQGVVCRQECATEGNRLSPWEGDRELYKKRNEVKRLFLRLKGFRRIFSRFDKLDVILNFSSSLL